MNKARTKRLGILLGVLVVLCIATIAVSLYNEEQENIANSNEVVLDIDIDTVTAISWEIDGTSYGFHLDSETGQWIYDEDEEFPLDEDVINELIEIFDDYEAEFIIEDVTDYSQYGLDDPAATITITLEDETVYEINLGDFSTLDSERYFEFGDGNVYLAVVDPYDSFDAITLSELILNDTIDEIDQADTITFSGAVNQTIYYEEESTNTYCSDDVYFIEDDDLPVDTSNIETYLSRFYSTELTSYVTYSATEEELEAYGFNDPLQTITIEYPATITDEDGEQTEGTKTVTLTIGVNQEELAAAQEELDEGEEVDMTSLTLYVRVDESQIIYELSTTRYEYLTACSYDDLRHSEVLTADFDSIYQFEFTIGDDTYTIYTDTDDDGNTVYYYYYDGEVVNEEDLAEDDDIANYRTEVDASAIEDAFDEITAESFTDEEPDGSLEISFVVYLNNENYEKVEVELYRVDGTYCLAVVDGEPVSFVYRTSVVDLIEVINSIVL